MTPSRPAAAAESCTVGRSVGLTSVRDRRQRSQLCRSSETFLVFEAKREILTVFTCSFSNVRNDDDPSRSVCIVFCNWPPCFIRVRTFTNINDRRIPAMDIRSL